MSRSPVVLALAFVLSFSPLDAQQPAITEKIEVRLLELDVVVTDREGNPVRGLTADDLELFENGKRQEITNLSEYSDVDVALVPGTQATAQAAAAVARPKPRSLVFLMDVLPNRPALRKQVFEKLTAFLDSSMRKGDTATILAWRQSGFHNVLGPEANIEAVRTSLATIEKGGGASLRGMTAEQEEAFFRGAAAAGAGIDVEGNVATSKRNKAEEEFALMRRKTASMQRIVASLGDPMRKTVVVYVSEQFPRTAGKRDFVGTRATAGPPGADELGFNTTPMIQAVVRTANSNGVSFYALRPSIPSTFGEMKSIEEERAIVDESTPGSEAMADQLVLQNEIDALTHLAEETGGRFGLGASGMATTLDRITRDLGSYYSIGYRARSDGTDRVRKIRIRAKNRDLVVRTRESIVEKSDRTRANDLLVARLFERGDQGSIQFEVKAGAPHLTRGKQSVIGVDLVIRADQLTFAKDGDETAARFTILTVAGANIGQTTNVTRDTRRVVAPAGQIVTEGDVRYKFEVVADMKRTTVAIGVYDENSGEVGIRTIDVEGGHPTVVAAQSTDSAGAAVLSAAADRAERERKPLVIFFRPARCKGCDAFEKGSIPHPTIARRMTNVVFATVPVSGGDGALWDVKDAGIAMFDRSRHQRARWIGVPDTSIFGAILDSISGAAPHFERAVQLNEKMGRYAGQVEVAIGLAKLGRVAEARAALDEAIANGTPEVAQSSTIALALFDVRERKTASGIERLQAVINDPRNENIMLDALLALGTAHRMAGADADAVRAYQQVLDSAASDSAYADAATKGLANLRAKAPATHSGPIRIVPFGSRIVSGREPVRTVVSSPAVARVVFSVDGKDEATVTRPPFSATLSFGRMPGAHSVRVVAFDRSGKEVGKDEVRVNDSGEVFWIRLTEPQPGPAGGDVPVAFTLRAPSARKLDKVTLLWNDKPVKVITAAPWRTVVNVPAGELGVLQAVADLDDGRRAEDAVVLNTGGYVERTEVQMVELPLTIRGDHPVKAKDFVVREGKTIRSVESITAGAEAPLTVGLLLDTSASMQKTLPDLQEAAIRFIDSVLQPADRAFVVAFNSDARLLQPPTSNRDELRRSIMTLRPDGLTALYDAMVLGLLQFEGVKGRRAIVAFTDGLDRTSRYDGKELSELARRSNVPIYLITSSTGSTMARPAPPMYQPGRPRGTTIATPPMVLSPIVGLETVASGSGGALFRLARFDQLNNIYDEIAAALRSQMLLTIRTDVAKDENEWRPLTVEISDRRLDVRAPSGYYAPH